MLRLNVKYSSSFRKPFFYGPSPIGSVRIYHYCSLVVLFECWILLCLAVSGSSLHLIMLRHSQ